MVEISMDTYVVLTGDIINFTTLDNEVRKNLITNAEKLIRSWVGSPDDAAFFRGDSYQLKVSPVPESSEMIVLRSDNPQTILPSGRYALVVKNIAYDLTIDGNSSDGAHCLERTEALGAPVYTVCRKP